MAENASETQAGGVKAEKESKERGARGIRRRRRNNKEATNRKEESIEPCCTKMTALLHRGFKVWHHVYPRNRRHEHHYRLYQ
jgi:hypothetical protein